MRVTERMTMNQLQSNINRNAEELLDLQDQLSSGKSLRKPSDDPKGVTKALRLSADSDRLDQYQENINSASSWMAASDSALGQLTDVLVKVRNVALSAASDTLGSAERSQLGAQVKEYTAEAVQLANSKSGGLFIFSGASTRGYYNTVTSAYESPFVIQPSVGDPTSTVSYRGDTSSSKTMPTNIGDGITIDMNIPGDFQVNGTNVLEDTLTTLNNLSKALVSNDTDAIGNSLTELSTASDNVLAVRGTVGARMTRLNSLESAYDTDKTDLTAQLSRVQDADVAEVMTKLTTQKTVYDTAIKAAAKTMQVSLLDYLN